MRAGSLRDFEQAEQISLSVNKQHSKVMSTVSKQGTEATKAIEKILTPLYVAQHHQCYVG
jgi:hypothetical protein